MGSVLLGLCLLMRNPNHSRPLHKALHKPAQTPCRERSYALTVVRPGTPIPLELHSILSICFCGGPKRGGAQQEAAFRSCGPGHSFGVTDFVAEASSVPFCYSHGDRPAPSLNRPLL